MTHLRLGRWVATVGLALGVASLGACASDSATLTDPSRPSFGGTPSDPTGDRTVEFELFELCKDYSGQAGPSVTFDVTVDRDNNNTGADVSFQVTLADGECQEIWTDGGPTQDLVTVTEQVPVPATGSYAPSFVKTTLVRTAGAPDAVVVGASTPGNSTSEAFSGDTPSGVVGVLVEFTNTYMPPPPGGGEGCTPGYWKNHTGLKSQTNQWPPTGYGQGDSYDATFGVSSSFGGTLLDAVRRGGGGEIALGRHAVAALLNSSHPDVSYDLSAAGVIAAVQAAYAGGDFEGVKNTLAWYNEQGCPIGN